MQDLDFSQDRRQALKQMRSSGAARFVFAIAVTLAAGGTAWAVWASRDILAFLGLLLLGSFSLRVFRDLLPASPSRRATWERLDQLDAQFPSHRLRGLLWLGVGLLAYKVLVGAGASSRDLFAPAALIAVGGIASAIWYWRHAGNVDEA
jgi:hypothetical protein